MTTVGDGGLVARQHFIQDGTVVADDIVGGSGAGAAGEIDEGGRAIREPSSRQCLSGGGVSNAVDLDGRGVRQRDERAGGRQLEVHVRRADEFIGEDLGEAEGRQEGQRGELRHFVRNREVNSLERNRQRGGVVKFEPIALTGQAVRHPFVDGETALRRRDGGGIRGVGRRSRQHPLAGDAAGGVVGDLQTERDRIHAVGGRVVEEEVSAGRIEGEARVQAGRSVGQ